MASRGTNRIQPHDVDEPLESTDPISGATTGMSEYKDEPQVDWLQMATNNFENARSYMDASLIWEWERNVDHFNGRHFRRSHYHHANMKMRSSLFRPMTRGAERKSSAQLAQAMFSNMDLIDVSPANGNDPRQVASARMMKVLLQHHLEKNLNWYLTALGAWQDCKVYGICVSHCYWDYEEKEVEVDENIYTFSGQPDYDDDGKKTTKKTKKTIILRDKPAIDLDPPENVLLDPACDWRDPVNTAAYVVRIVPMYVVDVEAKMRKTDDKTGLPEWKLLERGQILASRRDLYNTVRQAREGDNRPDKFDNENGNEFTIVFAQQNFVRLSGKEYVYWTMGTEYMLTKPVLLHEVYWHGRRPLQYGFSVIEAHRFSPSSTTSLISDLQIAINDVANLRFDNVRLALNKRYFLRRGASIDLEALMRSTPGGAVLTENPEADIKIVTTPDVTGSSYKEQERIETEADQLTGVFSNASIQNNRSLNETVGGLEMLSQGADVVSEFDIRTFAETWLKPQLEQLVQLIQAYESDWRILNLAYDEAMADFDMFDPKDRESDINRMLKEKLTVKINVGLGATTPEKKVQGIMSALQAVSSIEGVAQRINADEVIAEIFTALGHQDGKRFINPAEDQGAPSEEEIAQMQQEAFQKGQESVNTQNKQMEMQMKQYQVDKTFELGMRQIAATTGIKMEELYKKLGIEQEKVQALRDIAAVRETNKTNELEFKRTTGREGI